MKSKTEEQGKYMKPKKKKCWPFEKPVTIDKALASLIRKKRGKRCYKYQKEKYGIPIHILQAFKIIRKHYE